MRPSKEWALPKDQRIHRLVLGQDSKERVLCGAPLRSSVVVADDESVTCADCKKAKEDGR